MSLLKALLFCGFVAVVYAKPNIESRIVGGSDANIGEFLYQASIRKRGSHICGGSVIAARFILTAGHCLCNTELTNLLSGIGLPGMKCNFLSELADELTMVVYVNTIYLSSGGSPYDVQNVIQHPQYSPSPIKNDIGLVQLELSISDPITFIPLGGGLLADELKLNLTGWGLLNTQATAPPDRLQKVLATKYNIEQCKQIMGSAVSDDNMCTLDAGKGSCYGDSGGPLVYQNILYAIVSWGRQGCASGYPDVNTKVRAHCDFIAATTVNAAVCVP